MGRWKLRPEPYKPNPVDADNDGIVQEQTIWERPAGTRFITEAGEAFLGGLDGTDASQLQGLRLVNEKNEPVDYEPSFRKEQISIGETFGTLGSKIGTLQGKPVQPEKVRPSRAPEPRLPISPRELADLRREYPDLFDDEGNLLDRIRDPRNPERYFLGRPVRNELEAINTPDELETYLKGKTIVSFDVETLGKITPEEENDDRIIQLGAVIYRDGEVVARFNKWIAAPWDSVGDWVRNNVKTNDGDPLTQEFLDSQQSTKEVLEEFFGWFRENTGGGPPVLFLGQNVEFDMLRLRNEVNRTAPVGGFTLDSVNSPYVDTQLLFKNMQRAGVAPDGQSSSLNKLRQFLGIKKDFDHHQADQDAEMTGDVLWALVDFLKVNDPNGSGTRRLLNVPEQNAAEQRSIEEWEAKREQYFKDKQDLEIVKALLSDVNKNVVDGEDDTPKIPLLGEPESRVKEDEALAKAAEEYTEKIDVESPDFMADGITPEDQERMQNSARRIIGMIGKVVGGNRGNSLDQESRKKIVPSGKTKIRINFKNENNQNISSTGDTLGYTIMDPTSGNGGYVNLALDQNVVQVNQPRPLNTMKEAVAGKQPLTSQDPTEIGLTLNASGGLTLIHELMHNEEFIGGSYAVYVSKKLGGGTNTPNKPRYINTLIGTFATKEEADNFVKKEDPSSFTPGGTFAVLENPVTGLRGAAYAKELTGTLSSILFEKDANGKLIAKSLPTEGYLRPEYKKHAENYQRLGMYVVNLRNVLEDKNSNLSTNLEGEINQTIANLEERLNKLAYTVMLTLPDAEKFIQSENPQNVMGLRVLQSVLAMDNYAAAVPNFIPSDPDLIFRNQLGKNSFNQLIKTTLSSGMSPQEIADMFAASDQRDFARLLQDDQFLNTIGLYTDLKLVGERLQLAIKQSKVKDPYNELFGGSNDYVKMLKNYTKFDSPYMKDFDGKLEMYFEKLELLQTNLQELLDKGMNKEEQQVKDLITNLRQGLTSMRFLVTDGSGNNVYKLNEMGERVLVMAPLISSNDKFYVGDTSEESLKEVPNIFDRFLDTLPADPSIRDRQSAILLTGLTGTLKKESAFDSSNQGHIMSTDYLLDPAEVWARTGTQYTLMSLLKQNGIDIDTKDGDGNPILSRFITEYEMTVEFGGMSLKPRTPEEIAEKLENDIAEIAALSNNPEEVGMVLRMMVSDFSRSREVSFDTHVPKNIRQFDEILAPAVAQMLETDLSEAVPSPLSSMSTMSVRPLPKIGFNKRQGYGTSIRQQFKPTRRRSSDGSIVELAQFPSDTEINTELQRGLDEFITSYVNPPIPLREERYGNRIIFSGIESNDTGIIQRLFTNIIAQNDISDDDKVAIANNLRETFSAEDLDINGQKWSNSWPASLRGDNFDWAGLTDMLLKKADILAEANSKEAVEKRKLEAQDPFVTIVGRVEEIDDMKVMITTTGDKRIERLLNVNRRPERFRWLEVISERFDQNPDVTSVDDRGNEKIDEDNATKLSKKFLEDEGILAALNRAYTAGVTRDERLGELRVALQELDAENANNGKSTNHVDDIDSWINVVDDALAIEGGAYTGLGPKALTRAEVEERDAKIRERLGIDPNAEIPKGSVGRVKPESLKQKLANTGQGQFISADTIEEKNDIVVNKIRELGGFWDPEELYAVLPEGFNKMSDREQGQVLEDLGFGETRSYDSLFKVYKPNPPIEMLADFKEKYNSPVTDEFLARQLREYTFKWNNNPKADALEVFKRLGLFDKDDPNMNKEKDFYKALWITSGNMNSVLYPEQPTDTLLITDEMFLNNPRIQGMLAEYETYLDRVLNADPEELFEEISFALDAILDNDDSEIRVQVRDFDLVKGDGFYKNTHFRQQDAMGSYGQIRSDHSESGIRGAVESAHGLPQFRATLEEFGRNLSPEEGESDYRGAPAGEADTFFGRIQAAPSSGYLYPKDYYEFIEDQYWQEKVQTDIPEEHKQYVHFDNSAGGSYGNTNSVVLNPEVKGRSKLLYGDAVTNGSLSTRLRDATPEERFNAWFTSMTHKGDHNHNLAPNNVSTYSSQDVDSISNITLGSGGPINRIIQLLAIGDAVKSSDEKKAKLAASIPSINLQSQTQVGVDLTAAGFTRTEADLLQSLQPSTASYLEVMTFGNWDLSDIAKIDTQEFAHFADYPNALLSIPSGANSRPRADMTPESSARLDARTELIEQLIFSGQLSPEVTEKFRDLKSTNPEQYRMIIETFDLGVSDKTFGRTSEYGKSEHYLFRFDTNRTDAVNFMKETGGVSVLYGIPGIMSYSHQFTDLKERGGDPEIIADLTVAMRFLMKAIEREKFANEIREVGEDIQLRYVIERGMINSNIHVVMEDLLKNDKWKTLKGMPEHLKRNPEIEAGFTDFPLETQARIIREAQALNILQNIGDVDRIFDSTQNPKIVDLPADAQDKIRPILGMQSREGALSQAERQAQREAELAAVDPRDDR